MKFTIHNENNPEIAFVTVRLSKYAVQAIRDFMHTDSKELTFPNKVTMVHQFSGWYRLYPRDNSYDPITHLKFAIRLITKAVREFQNKRNAEIRAFLAGYKPVAQSEGEVVLIKQVTPLNLEDKLHILQDKVNTRHAAFA